MIPLDATAPAAPLAYVALTAFAPIVATLLVTVVCALLFALMLALGLGAADRSVYSAGVFVAAVALHQLGRTALSLRLPRRRPPRIVPLTGVSRGRWGPATVGNKAANLARFMGGGLRVPTGWVVTVEGFRSYARTAGLDAHSDPAHVFERMAKTPVPRSLLGRLHRQLLASGGESFLLRSSFIDEDGAERAFAGVYESTRWKRAEGRAGLEASLKAVWASWWSARASAYRTRAGIEAPELPGLAVLVNPVVDHELSGFASSTEVWSGFGDRHLVDVATPGREWTGVHCLLADTIESLSGSADGASVLPDGVVREISALAGRAERELGSAVEIEWGMDRDGALWLYQARPLTALPAVQVLTCGPSFDVPRYPLTPLSWSMLFGEGSPARLLGSGLELLGLGRLEDDDVLVHEGRIFLRWSRVKPFVQGGLREVRPRGAFVLLAILLRAALSLRRARFHTPPVPAPPDPSLSVAELVEQLRLLAAERIAPTVRRQSVVLQAAGMLEALLRQSLPRERLPAPRVRTAVDEAFEHGGDERRAAARAIWYLSEREAEIAAPRAIDDPAGAAMHLGLGRATAPASPAGEAARRPSLPAPLKLVVRVRDALLERREQLNARVNVTNYEARLVAEALSARLGADVPGWRVDDIYYLTLPELHEIAALGVVDQTVLATIVDRRAELAAWDADEPDPILRLDASGRALDPPQRARAMGDDFLVSGVPLGGGTVEGELHFVHGGDRLVPEAVAGKVVVLPGPSPLWAAVARAAAGVVIARGGPLSHLAIWCRERGIPSVVATGSLAEEIGAGEHVLLDADQGLLRRV